MNVRKFVAPTVAEALAKVKKEIGDEAVILRTRTIKEKGALSIFAKDMVEVMAAMPDRSPPEENAGPSQVNQILQRLDRRPDVRAVTDLREEISEIKGHIKDLALHVTGEQKTKVSAEAARLQLKMVEAGVEAALAAQIAAELDKVGVTNREPGFAEKELIGLIARKIKISRPKIKGDQGAKVIALIGPTGVGKTTTLAKLVTSYRHWGGSNSAIVSADTYRVAALDQIKTFASIAGLPMEAVYNPASMPVAIARHKHRDAIFVDTPGRSQSDSQKLEELAAFLDAAGADERFLCLAVNTRIEDQLDIIDRYGKLNPTGIIFTKLDDSRHPGGILGVSAYSQIPLTYMTCGQNVPDDVVTADQRRIAELVVYPESLGKLQRERFASWIERDETMHGGRNGV